MTRTLITAHITGDVASVFAFRSALIDAAGEDSTLTVTTDDLGNDVVVIDVDTAATAATLAVLADSSALGQITF